MQPKKLARKIVPKRGIKTLEKSYRKSRGVFWQTRHGFPARSMRVIAVTGTNGKTTTCSYISEVLKASGHTTAVYTTAFYEVAGKLTANRSHMTVTSQRDVQRFFARAKKAQVDYVVLEVTSHALEQGRIAGVPVEVGVLTNLTQDHLDYHGTMERYARAKSLLFQNYGAKYAVLNADDEWFKFFAGKSTAQVFSFGKNKAATAQLQSVMTSAEGSVADLVTDAMSLKIKTSLIGEFNLYNAAAAASVGSVLGISGEAIEEGVSNLKAVPGRMEAVEAGQDFQVLVDFAYTPDALLNALTTLKKVSSGKIRIVFGATGDRDASKRPLMGTVVAENADVVYLTDDETYTEDPASIRDAVYAGIVAAGGRDKTQVFDDRLDAIKQAFKDAKKGDVVLLAGIGHEDYRNMGGKKMPWDERQIAVQELQNIK